MPSGLRIDLNDGGPVMEITAGMRCPSFCQQVSSAWDVNQYTIANYVAGSQIVVLPRNTVFSMYRDTALIPTIGMFSGYSVSGNTITLNTWWSDNWQRVRTFDSTFWQILPAASGQGLFIQDSSDFLAITDATMVGSCVWRGTITFNGSWSTPTTVAPREKYLVFASWSADGVVIEFDGYTITATQELDGADIAATVTMTIAIFASGVAPVAGTGLNMFKNGTCVFSTTRRPFIYRNVTYTPGWDWQDIGPRMIMLGRYGYDSRVNGGWDYLKWAGLVRSGNSVRCSRGKTVSTWTSRYSAVGQRLTSLQIPCIESMY
ncbi:MAG: hypothetical protein KH310_24745 [Enterobacteriaceae bacterium]|nr:hypothetical protein [Enterobacteriaceae bacterium]